MLHRNTTTVYTADTLKKELAVIEIKYWNKI